MRFDHAAVGNSKQGITRAHIELLVDRIHQAISAQVRVQSLEYQQVAEQSTQEHLLCSSSDECKEQLLEMAVQLQWANQSRLRTEQQPQNTEQQLRNPERPVSVVQRAEGVWVLQWAEVV